MMGQPARANAKIRPDVQAICPGDLTTGYSPREKVLDEDHVLALVEVIDRLPPIIVNEESMTVIDGVHRLEAFRRAGRDQIKVVYFAGDETGARVVAIQANIKHGKPLSPSERQAAARMLLSQCPELSDRWVGEVCGLSHSTAARLRFSSGTVLGGARIGRDGRRRPVDPMPGQEAVVRALTESPGISSRRAAEAAGVAPSTAHRVRTGLQGKQVQPAPPSKTTPTVKWASESTLARMAEVTVDGTGPRSLLARTAVAPEEVRRYVESVPLGHLYEVADECRRRAHLWAEMADTLEKQARLPHPSNAD